MNRTGLWIVVVVAAVWVGFLLGYSMSAHTGAKPAQAGTPAPVSGGYGGGQAATAAKPAKPAAGGYGR